MIQESLCDRYRSFVWEGGGSTSALPRERLLCTPDVDREGLLRKKNACNPELDKKFLSREEIIARQKIYSVAINELQDIQ